MPRNIRHDDSDLVRPATSSDLTVEFPVCVRRAIVSSAHFHFAGAVRRTAPCRPRLLGTGWGPMERAYLVVHQMKFQQADVADGTSAERFAGAAVLQRYLAGRAARLGDVATMSFFMAPSNTGVATGTPARRLPASSGNPLRRPARRSSPINRLRVCAAIHAAVAPGPCRTFADLTTQPAMLAEMGFENRPTMRLGTPSGFKTTSTGVPSARYGISSIGVMREITPLLPWRRHLVPGWSLASQRQD